ncbi:MAG TPA: CRISPR-associated protein Cas4 [Anaerolineae bacterium]|nr:CRISPR-associated protein Cas4 [Anaerolineae bacterium]
MEILLILVVVLALIGAVLLRALGRSERAATGLPIDARLVYSDTGAWRRVDKALFSQRYRLTGKPDYVVADKAGAMIPIEVKPNRTDAQARDSDVMQLMAYGILVEETYGARPEYGLLKYRDQVFQIEFTEELRGEFFAILEEMRAARNAENVHRSHNDPTRCRYCGYRDECEEKLI